MGVSATHYIIYGTTIKGEQVKKFFAADNVDDICDQYDDNGYNEEITPTESGIHLITDGMNTDYIVAGKILHKSVEDGFGFCELYAPDDVDVITKLVELDKKANTCFAGKKPWFVVFTHWH